MYSIPKCCWRHCFEAEWQTGHRLPKSLPASLAGAWLSLPCAWSSSFLPPPPPCRLPGQKIICWSWQGILVLKTGHCFPKERLAACSALVTATRRFCSLASWAPGVPGWPSRQGWWSDEAQTSWWGTDITFPVSLTYVGVTPEVFIGFLHHLKNSTLNLIRKNPKTRVTKYLF